MDETSAYHESGHALIGILLGARIRWITIEPDRDDGPDRFAEVQMEWAQGQYSAKEWKEISVQVALAGPVAEMIHTGEPYHPGFVAEWSADWKQAWQDAELLCQSEKRRLKYLEETTAFLYRFLRQDEQWAALSAIVDNLLAHETLEGDVVHEIVNQWL